MKYIILLVLLAAYNAQNACCQNNVLSIIGAGTVSSDPDIGQFTVSATAFGTTSALALSSVNAIISQVSGILAAKGLPKANYTTSAINLYPQYNYTTDGIAILIGQQASESLSVTVGNLNQNKQLIGQIITALSNVNNITISGLTFSNSNTDLVNRLARKAAVADAVAKAKQYSTLSGKNLGSVKQIVDQNSENYVPFYADYSLYSFRAQVLQVPYGQVTASATVQINWNLSY
jgi:uncharacterized protein YggE